MTNRSKGQLEELSRIVGGCSCERGGNTHHLLRFFSEVKRKILLTLSQLEIVNVWSMEDNSVI